MSNNQEFNEDFNDVNANNVCVCGTCNQDNANNYEDNNNYDNRDNDVCNNSCRNDCDNTCNLKIEKLEECLQKLEDYQNRRYKQIIKELNNLYDNYDALSNAYQKLLVDFQAVSSNTNVCTSTTKVDETLSICHDSHDCCDHDHTDHSDHNCCDCNNHDCDRT